MRRLPGRAARQLLLALGLVPGRRQPCRVLPAGHVPRGADSQDGLRARRRRHPGGVDAYEWRRIGGE
jgi:hypothetical protein